MALFSVKLNVNYTVEVLVADVSSAEEARKRAAVDAADAVEAAFMDEHGTSVIGESTVLSAVCVNALE